MAHNNPSKMIRDNNTYVVLNKGVKIFSNTTRNYPSYKIQLKPYIASFVRGCQPGDSKIQMFVNHF